MVHPAVAEIQEEKISALENFLLTQFDSDVGLVRESPDVSINRTYWLLSDNLFASHVLKQNHPEVAAKINQTLIRYGRFHDGLHEVVFGEVIHLPPYAPQTVTIDSSDDWKVKIEVRDAVSGKLMDDWIDYADILLYAALNEYNRGDYDSALFYFTRAKEMWNGAGLYDKPTRQDGYYTTHKLALLLHVANILNQTLPFREELESRIWMFQRRDGGIRSHYLGNMTSDREANSETTALVLSLYQFEAEQARLKSEAEEQARLKIIEERQNRLFIFIIIFGSLTSIVIVAILLRKRLKKLLVS
jgi:HEPN domain-containing protein